MARSRSSLYRPEPPAGLKPPFRWGTRKGIEELFGDGAVSIDFDRRTLRMYYRSSEHAVDVLRKYFGPMMVTFENLDEAGRRRLHDDLLEFHRRQNVATDGTHIEEPEYLLSVIVRC